MSKEQEQEMEAEIAILVQRWKDDARFARTLCWSFVLQNLTFLDAFVKVHATPEGLAKRDVFWQLARRGPDDPGFVNEVLDSLRTADEILDGTVDPQQAIALLNDEGLKVVTNVSIGARDDNWIMREDGWRDVLSNKHRDGRDDRPECTCAIVGPTRPHNPECPYAREVSD